MEIDDELKKEILLETEKSVDGQTPIKLQIKGCDHRQVSYHIKHLQSAGLIEAKNFSSKDGMDWRVVDLTPQGHEAIRKIKKGGSEEIPEATPPSDPSQVGQYEGFNIWELLNKKIVSVSKDRFQNAHYSDAVFAAFRKLEAEVKEEYQNRNGEETHGRDLMFQAFSLEKPNIQIPTNLDNESQRDIQEGYKFIYGGAMQGIRNPKAHDDIPISKEWAIHFLFLASLLMDTLESSHSWTIDSQT